MQVMYKSYLRKSYSWPKETDSDCYFDDSQPKSPPPLSAAFEQPNKSEAIVAHKSRFKK